MRSKSADLTPAIAITSARDDVFDFSYPTLETGLQIMVRETGATQGTPSRLAPYGTCSACCFRERLSNGSA